MKMIINAILFLSGPLLCIAQPTDNAPLTITFRTPIAREQNMIGLQRVDIAVANVASVPVKISSRQSLILEGRIAGQQNWTRFSERNLISSNGNGSTFLSAHDSIVFTTNLNLFDFTDNYYRAGGAPIQQPVEVAVRAGVYCFQDKKTYYSGEQRIVLSPLSKIDQEAFLYIVKRGFDPYEFAGTARITVFGIKPEIGDSVITRFPTSTFATLATLSQAYKATREDKTKTIDKALVQKLLNTASSYTYIQYLIKELQNKQ